MLILCLSNDEQALINDFRASERGINVAKLKILVAGDPILRTVCEPVKRIDKKLQRLLKDMAETMYDAEGVGLAAPQIGITKRIVVIDVGDEVGLLEMINPEITLREGSALGAEGCLSVPDFEGEVERASHIECEFTDRNGKRMKLTADGLLAVCVQHECDHLDGILFVDKAQTLTRKEQEKPTDAVKKGRKK